MRDCRGRSLCNVSAGKGQQSKGTDLSAFCSASTSRGGAICCSLLGKKKYVMLV